MKVLVLYAHPLGDSFNAEVHRTVLNALRAAGHEVDDCDLYAEKFDPVLSAAERQDYHDLTRNRALVDSYAVRLQRADAVVFVFPTWSFGVPAILKGWFDRVLVPGVSFTLGEDGIARPALTNIKRIVGVATYGRPWWHVRLIVGDLPRGHITRYFKALCGFGCRANYVAFYDMNRGTMERRRRFLDRAWTAMTQL